MFFELFKINRLFFDQVRYRTAGINIQMIVMIVNFLMVVPGVCYILEQQCVKMNFLN